MLSFNEPLPNTYYLHSTILKLTYSCLAEIIDH